MLFSQNILNAFILAICRIGPDIMNLILQRILKHEEVKDLGESLVK